MFSFYFGKYRTCWILPRYYLKKYLIYEKFKLPNCVVVRSISGRLLNEIKFAHIVIYT
jgi:hypothetical protein